MRDPRYEPAGMSHEKEGKIRGAKLLSLMRPKCMALCIVCVFYYI